MNSEDRDRKLDRLLDDALASYSQAEPRAGFEERILAKVRAQPQRSRRWAWLLMAAAVAAVVLIVASVFMPKRPRIQEVTNRSAKPVIPAQVPTTATAPPLATQVVPRPASRVARAHPYVQNSTEPRLAVFPAPVPLSPEEQLLLRLAHNQPGEVLVVAKAQEAQTERLKKFAETGVLPPPEDSVTAWH